jgi:hypothetical protein
MPKGKKLCPDCATEHGARKKVCECGHEFGSKQGKPASPAKKVKQKKHPLGHHMVSPGLWVYDLPKGMPKIHLPDPLPHGPMTNQEVYDHVAYNGLGDSIFENIPSNKIADPKLKKLWIKARKAMDDVWRHLIDDE